MVSRHFHSAFPARLDVLLFAAFGFLAIVLSSIGSKLWAVPLVTAISASFLTAALFMLLYLAARAALFLRYRNTAASIPNVVHIKPTSERASRAEQGDLWQLEPIYQLATGEVRHFFLRPSSALIWRSPDATKLGDIFASLERRILAEGISPKHKILFQLTADMKCDPAAVPRLEAIVLRYPLLRMRLLFVTAKADMRERLRAAGLSCAGFGLNANGRPDPHCGVVVLNAGTAEALPPTVPFSSDQIFILEGVDDIGECARLFGRGFQLGCGEAAEFATFAKAKAA